MLLNFWKTLERVVSLWKCKQAFLYERSLEECSRSTMTTTRHQAAARVRVVEIQSCGWRKVESSAAGADDAWRTTCRQPRVDDTECLSLACLEA